MPSNVGTGGARGAAPWGRAFLATLLLTIAALIVQPSAAYAQEAPAADERFTVEAQPVAAFGVAGGFPAYQTVTGLVSVQYLWGGLALRAGTGTAGVQASLDLRAYPPVPIPVPVYGAVGLNLYGARVAYHVAAGAHVPVTLRWRFDLEAGVAWVPLGFERKLAPHLIVGVSYAIPFEPGILVGERTPGRFEGEDRFARAPSPGCADPVAPSTDGVDRAVEEVARDFLEDAQSVYGSVYADLRYDWDIEDVTFDGPRAVAEVEYSGSVREIATGTRQSADGVAIVDLAWTGCRWTGVGLSY